MAEQEKDAQFVETVAKMLVEKPDSVEVNRTIDDLGVLITLRVDASDMATIIGREGRAAKSIRTLLRIIGAKDNQRVNLKIVEPDGSDSGHTRSASNDEVSSDSINSDITYNDLDSDKPSAKTEEILNDIPDSIV